LAGITFKAADLLLDFMRFHLKQIISRFVNPHAIKAESAVLREVPGPAMSEGFCDYGGQILGSWHKALEFRHLFIQIAMSEPGENFFLHPPIEQAALHQKTGDGIRFAADAHLKKVIVAMTVRVVALPEDTAIFFLA
jgi:hypothetical protein